MIAPVKPFDTYKWRWLSVQPSEGLLRAPVFLGVLRALNQFEGEPYSSINLHEELGRVRHDTGTDIDLARTPERNLFRNSGQYWRGTGLVAPVGGVIRLTDLGRRVAAGQITNDEFAALMVRNTVLPNPQTYNPADVENWQNAGLRIKPFELILAVMNWLGRSYGIGDAYLTPNELIRVVIPLSGANTEIETIVEAVHEFRAGRLDTAEWPNCAPAANDRRLAREFLLFLENFEICQTNGDADRYETRFSIDQVFTAEQHLGEQISFLENNELIDEEIANSRGSEIPIFIERKRVNASVMRRTNQTRFRKDVLNAAAGRCLLTSETTSDVLEAAHIVPVGHGGVDDVRNGFCMRVDIHRLFDGGKIRISPDGSVSLNEQIQDAVSYNGLPARLVFPAVVGVENIEWRERYL